jgi:DNA-binding CsgD family transcriptional regulator
MKLWREGKDTNDIASALRVKESYVYNNLPRYREADKRIMKRAGIAT